MCPELQASAGKLAALEEDRTCVVRAYNDRLAALEGELQSARAALEEQEATLGERDEELERAEAEAAALEVRTGAGQLADGGRGAALTSYPEP